MFKDQLVNSEDSNKSNEAEHISDEKQDRHSSQHAGCGQNSDRVPIINVAITTRKRINDLLRSNTSTVTFQLFLYSIFATLVS